MRIACPWCGERGVQEFSYRGDAAPRRPGAAGEDGDAWFSYVYLRGNPAGPHLEYWQHSAGCRGWIVVSRDTRTHEILSVTPPCATPGGAAA